MSRFGNFLCAAVLLVLGLSAVVQGTKTPNIVFIVADDLGWNDVGWNNPAMITPNLDKLAKQGVILNHTYVQPVCSPSRTAFMTGCFPYRAGMQHGVIRPLEPKGVPLNFTLLPEKLKEVGYATHAIGKWHLGFCNLSYTPMRRGFDSHYGYYLGAEDYYLHIRPGDSTIGYDFRNGTQPDTSAKGTYSTFLFAKRAEQIIRTQKEDQPLFLYLPFQAVHGPIEVPERFENMYKTIHHQTRRKYCGMVSALDEAVGNITKALEAKGMLENTIIAFTTDNGGIAAGGGNNWPLRGQKGTLWEGGTRGPAFVTGGVFETAKRKTYTGLFHAVDWFPTLLAAAGHPGGLPLIDGIDQLENILLPNSPSVRTEFIYNADNIDKNGAIRVGDWKLIVGVAGSKSKSGWTPPPKVDGETDQLNDEHSPMNYPERNDLGYVTMVDNFADDTEPPQPNLRQLFHLGDDPTEHHDMSKKYPFIVNALYQKFVEMTSGYKAYTPPQTPRGDPKNFGGFWSPGWCKAV